VNDSTIARNAAAARQFAAALALIDAHAALWTPAPKVEAQPAQTAEAAS